MRVIFLDIDGVLITDNDIREASRRGWGRPWPNAKRVYELNRILSTVKVRVVVSSSWRIGRTLEDLTGILESWGVGSLRGCLPCWLEDATPNLGNKKIGSIYVARTRGDEIREWLDVQPWDIDSFVILDDNSDMGDLSHRLVQCSMEDGLTEELADRAIAMLREG